MHFRGLLPVLLFSLLLPLLPSRGADGAVQLVRVFSGKVRYRPREAGVLQVTLKNPGAVDLAVTVEAELVQELARVTPLPARPATVPAGKEAVVEVPFTTPAHEYGCAVRIHVKQGDTVLTQGQEMLAVADNVWKVANGAGGIDIMTMSGFGWVNPQKDIAVARAQYFTWWEKMFWPPDDFGGMQPAAESWYSGQGGRYEIKKVIKEFTRLARENGLASVTYGKSTSGGPAGWELARRHPDWFKQDRFGRIIGIYDTGIFAQWDTRDRNFNRGWWYLYPNLSRLDTLDWGIDQLIGSAQEYGWDGVRFDGDFTWVGNDEVAARNQRRMKERIWTKLPGYVFGYNQGYRPPTTDPATWPHSSRETFAGGAHWMNEGIRNWGYATNGAYKTYRDYWQQESRAADILRMIGATYHFIYDTRKNVQGQYKFVLGTALGAHPVYGDSAVVPGCANWGRFLARWSAFVWDVNLRNRPDTEAAVTTAEPLWTAVKARVVDANTQDLIVHLIVPPTKDDVQAADVQIGAAAHNATVRAHIPAGARVLRAATIAPEHPDDATELPVTRDGEWVVATVPEVTLWTMVVFEYAGTFTVPAYPRFTEPPDAARVEAGVEEATGMLVRDPLRPDLPTPEASSAVQVLEMEGLYQTQAKVEADKDASGGACTRIDYTMSNSTVITHAIFRNVIPGRYRATYRLKLKSKTDDAGKAIWAGFGLYVNLGARQVWLKEIGPNDFKTPGQYEDFTVEFDFLGEGSTITTAAFWRGQQAGGTVYADRITLERLADYSDAVLAEKLKYVERVDLTPGGAPGLDVLVVNGLYHDFYRLPEALKLIGSVLDITPKPAAPPAGPDASKEETQPASDVRVAYATVRVNENDAVLTGYPVKYEELCAYDVVVLINTDATWLGFPGRAALRDFVNAGGGLLVLGGNFSLGQGSFANTFLADMLPVNVREGRDVEQVAKPLPLKPAPAGLARALPAAAWNTPAILYWRHRVTPKPDARVHLLAGSEPVLLTGAYGKGRVAVFTGTVLGQPAGTEQSFWAWPAWPALLRGTLGWLARVE